ncbi:hypothetical protein D3C85_1461650 [compost metagenome]
MKRASSADATPSRRPAAVRDNTALAMAVDTGSTASRSQVTPEAETVDGGEYVSGAPAPWPRVTDVDDGLAGELEMVTARASPNVAGIGFIAVSGPTEEMDVKVSTPLEGP